MAQATSGALPLPVPCATARAIPATTRRPPKGAHARQQADYEICRSSRYNGRQDPPIGAEGVPADRQLLPSRRLAALRRLHEFLNQRQVDGKSPATARNIAKKRNIRSGESSLILGQSPVTRNQQNLRMVNDEDLCGRPILSAIHPQNIAPRNRARLRRTTNEIADCP